MQRHKRLDSAAPHSEKIVTCRTQPKWWTGWSFKW